jgi:hypothetical protein
MLTLKLVFQNYRNIYEWMQIGLTTPFLDINSNNWSNKFRNIFGIIILIENDAKISTYTI